MDPAPLPLPLDDDGLLRPSAFDQASAGPALRVFAQLSDAAIDIQAWDRHATRFFDANVRLTRPKRYREASPRVDGAHLHIERRGHAPWLQTVFLRPRSEEDLASALAAEGGGGLALLAKRCSMVVLVSVPAPTPALDGPSNAESQTEPMFVAALLASVLLGPILSADGARIFGARTARSLTRS